MNMTNVHTIPSIMYMLVMQLFVLLLYFIYFSDFLFSILFVTALGTICVQGYH